MALSKEAQAVLEAATILGLLDALARLLWKKSHPGGGLPAVHDPNAQGPGGLAPRLPPNNLEQLHETD